MRRLLHLMMILCLASACSLHGAASTGGKGGPFTLVWGKETDPAGINPMSAGDVHAWEIFSLVYEPLTRPNKDLTVGPGLAASWKQLSATSWRFRLRDGVKFSNGRPLTSDDVVGTWAAYKKTGVLDHLFPNVDTMKAVDPLTFDVMLDAPMPDLPNRFEILWILPAKELAAGTYNPNRDLLGTGPYVAGAHVKGVSWTFTPNKYYWQKGLPAAKRLDVRFIPDDASRLAAARTGQVDFAIIANPDVQKILAGDPRLKVLVQQTTDLYYLHLNPAGPQAKLHDPRVRQAIALAIDRKQLISDALGGIGQITGITPRALPNACDPAGVPGATGRDVEKAKGLLKQAGVTNLRFRIAVTTGFGALRSPQMAQVIQQNLNDIGVHASVSVLDPGAWLDQVKNAKFDASLNWLTGNGTVSHIIGYFEPTGAGLFLKSISRDPANIALIRKAQSTPEGPGRAEAFAKACASMNDLAYFLPLVTKPTVIVYRADRIKPVFNPVEPTQMTFRRLAEFAPAS